MRQGVDVRDAHAAFGVLSAQLRRTLREQFGASILRYQLTMRIVAAIDDLRGGNPDAIALRAGYRAKRTSTAPALV